MIINTTQVKSLLNINSTAYDTIIADLIPEVEAKYLQVRNRPFDRIQADTAAADSTITNICFYPPGEIFNILFLDKFDYLVNSDIDNYITEIDLINETIEIDTPATDTKINQVFTVYPQGSKLTAAKMIKYFINRNSMSGLQSETVGSYSWSNSSTGNPFGIPDDIYKSIKRYI